MSTDFGISAFDRSSLRQQNKSSVDWISAYMEWMDMERTDWSGSPDEASADNSELFVVAYLEWMDAERPADEFRPSCPATVSANYRRIKDDGIRDAECSRGRRPSGLLTDWAEHPVP